MKIKSFARLPVFLFFTVAVALFAFGCATQEQHSFNADYNQNLRTAPNYFIEEVDANSFTITASQGQPSTGPERVFDVKRATTTVAATEAKRRGWQNWNVDYIAEYNDGWMHIVKAKVVRQNAVEYKSGQP